MENNSNHQPVMPGLLDDILERLVTAQDTAATDEAKAGPEPGNEPP